MLRVLTVDDDAIIQTYLNQVLAPMAQNQMAYSGQEALEALERSLASGELFQLILMDVLMPGMDGLATTRAVVDMLNSQDVPQELRPKIIMLTSVDERDTKIDAIYGCGADWYLVKPLDESDLIMAMEGLGLSLPGEMA